MKASILTKYFSPVILLCVTLSVSAITFNTENLVDSSESNYVKFEGKYATFSNYFEKISADFNGDGTDDILSFGGDSDTLGQITTPGPGLIAPLEMMLNIGGNFIYHELNIAYHSKYVQVVDIDSDGDLDIVMDNGRIAVNNGAAVFTEAMYSDSINLSGPFYIADIDSDTDPDIISNSYIFINNGDILFSEIITPAAGQILGVADINGDSFVDILVNNNQQIQTWLNTGSGEFSLTDSLDIADNIALTHPYEINGITHFYIVYSGTNEDYIEVLINNGQGQFSREPFALDVGNLNYDSLRIGKIFTRDADNDGDDDLWISAIFTDYSSCSNKQNLVFLYEKLDNGKYSPKNRFHSFGYSSNSLSLTATAETFPTLADLNGDDLPELIMTGDHPVSWINHTGYSGDFHFTASAVSGLSVINNIQILDYNGDGNADILSSGYDDACSVPDLPTGIYSTAYSLAGRLWLADSSNNYTPYHSGIAGFAEYNTPSRYSALLDLKQNGSPIFIDTYNLIGENGSDTETVSYISYPETADPGIIDYLPVPTLQVKAADLNQNDLQELVILADTEQSGIYIMAFADNSLLPTDILQVLDFPYPDGQILIADMENDGNKDIISNSRQNQNAVTIWYNDGDAHFTPSSLPIDASNAVAVMDFNNDGLKDILSSDDDNSIWLNQGNHFFARSNYDNSFWHSDSFSSDIINVMDINSDGREDIITVSDNYHYVYINDSNGQSITFYQIYSGLSEGLASHKNILFADINNDGQTDYVGASESGIKIYTQHQEQVKTGLYYNPQKSGHGFSIDAIGHHNLYYSVFFTYDELGKPQWYSNLNRYAGNEKYFWDLNQVDSLNMIRFIYDYNTHSATFDTNDENSGYLIFGGDNDSAEVQNTYLSIGDWNESWNLDAIIDDDSQPDTDFSGIWWAGSGDSGWGISLSLVQRDDAQVLIAILYFYDENGSPRWIMGQNENFIEDTDITIEMKQINGYGRQQNFVQATTVDAGTITLRLKQPSADLSQGGIMSMNVYYPEDTINTNNWIRDSIPIALFSKPKS